MKRPIAIFFSIIVLVITLLNETAWKNQNGIRALSGGAIADLPLHDGTAYETAFRTPDSDVIGLGLHIRYPVGEELENEKISVVLRDSMSGDTILDRSYYLNETGYCGQNVNEGVLLIPLNKPLGGGHRIQMSLKGSGISEKKGISLRTRNEQGLMEELLCNGEKTDTCLYAVAYTLNKAAFSVRSLLFGLIIAAAILLWGFLSESGKAELNRRSFHGLRFRRIPGRRWVWLILALIVQLTVLEFGYYAGIRHSLDEKIEQNRKSNQVMILNPGSSLTFDLRADSRDLAGFGVDLKHGYQTDQKIELSVKEADSDTKEMTWTVAMDRILPEKDGTYQIFYFPDVIHDSRDKTYEVTLRYLSGNGDLELTAAKPDSEDAPKEPYVCGEYRNRLFLLKLYCLIAIVTVLCTCLIWFCSVQDVSWLRYLPIVFLSVGICQMLLNKPLSVPDESIHFDEAYKISNQLLGIPQPEIPEGIYKRSCDIFTDYLAKEKLDGEAFRWERDTLRLEIRNWPTRYDEDLRLVYARHSGNGFSKVFYIPAALGLTAGRLFGFGLMGIMYMARFFQFAAGMALLTFAVRRIPLGRPVLVALAFMPAAMKELVSVSYDAIIIPVCFACFAQAMHMLLDSEESTFDDIFLLLLLSLLAGINKAGTYAPIGILSVAAVYARIRHGRKEIRQSSGRADRFRRILPYILIAAAVAVILLSFGKIYLERLNITGMVGYNSRTENSNYTFAYLVRHPAQLMRIIEGTLYWGAGIPLGITGSWMGWVYGFALDIPVRMVGIAYLVFSCIGIRGEKIPGRKIKTLCVMAFSISVAAFNFAMLTSWTSLGAKSISGVQGRYYLPVLPLLLIALRGRSPVFMAAEEDGSKNCSSDCHTIDYAGRCERNLMAAGFAYSVLTMVSFVVNAFG